MSPNASATTAATAAPHSTAPVQIKPRNRSHDIAAALHGEWMCNDVFLTAFFNAMSITFPVGEKFFIDSVRHYAPRIDDPVLRDQIKGFCGQEGFHRREHQLYNEALAAARGYDVQRMERKLAWRLGWAQKHLSPLKNLAITVCIEHFTAVLADLMMQQGSILDRAEPSMRQLWRWHAAEEMEHKSVAFDVYRAVGGTDKLRRAVMRRLVIMLTFELGRVLFGILRHDGRLFSLRLWRDGLSSLFGKGGAFSGGMPLFKEFFRDGFHPWQQDTSALLAQWIAETQAAGTPA